MRGEWDEDTLERSRWCLDSQRIGLEVLIEELSGPAVPIERAVGAASSLPPGERCRDATRLRSMPALPNERAAVTAIERQLWRVRTLNHSGQFSDGLRVAASTQVAADELGWAPLMAEVRLQTAKMSMHLGDHPSAEATYEQAYFGAAEAGADELAFYAATALVRITNDRPEQALRWSRHAQVSFTALGLDDDALRAPLLHNLALLHRRRGDYERAQELHEQELAILEPLLGPEHPDVGRAVLDLALVHLESGAFASSEEHYRRALAILDDSFGPHHPFVAAAHTGLGRSLFGQKLFEDAKIHLERAIAIKERAFGPENPRLSQPLHELASTLENLGEHEQAELVRARAQALREHRPRDREGR